MKIHKYVELRHKKGNVAITVNKKSFSNEKDFSLVAGAGLEPTTFGL